MYRRIALRLPNYIQQGAKRGTWRQDWLAYAIYQAMLWFSPLMLGYNPLILRQCHKTCCERARVQRSAAAEPRRIDGAYDGGTRRGEEASALIGPCSVIGSGRSPRAMTMKGGV